MQSGTIHEFSLLVMTDPMQRLEQDFARILGQIPAPDAPMKTSTEGDDRSSSPKQ